MALKTTLRTRISVKFLSELLLKMQSVIVESRAIIEATSACDRARPIEWPSILSGLM